MIKSKQTNERINLISTYRAKRRCNNHEYKAEYNRMLPTKLSSSNLLSLYTLFLLNKSSEPLYGKEMLNKIQSIANNYVWNPSHGTYYPLLEKMDSDGLIKKVKTNRSKNFYSITELGKTELADKLNKYKPILIRSAEFFDNILSEMYGEEKNKAAE